MTRVVWILAVGLALLGVTAGVLRAVYPGELAVRMDPVRQTILDGFGVTDVADLPCTLDRMSHLCGRKDTAGK